MLTMWHIDKELAVTEIGTVWKNDNHARSTLAIRDKCIEYVSPG